MRWLTANEPLTTLPSSWYAEGRPPYVRAPTFAGQNRCQICVIGAGVTGLSAALLLAEQGRDVCLLEAAQAGWGASGRNGGQVGSGLNWDHNRLERALGAEDASAVHRLTEAAKQLTHRLIKAHAADADPRPGILYAYRRPPEPPACPPNADQLRALDAAETARITGTQIFAGATLDLGASVINPLAYAQGLAQAVRGAGVRLYEGSPVRRLSATAPFSIETDLGQLVADQVVLASNGYHDRLLGRVADHVLPINNYIATTEPLGDRAPLAAPYGVVDDRFVVNYWHQSRDGRLIYGGGESYGRRFPKDIVGKVRRHLARTYPDLAGVRFTHAWGGTLAVTPTRLPYAAMLAPGLVTVGGYSGHGLALSAYAGRSMAKKLMGRPEDFDLLARLPTPPLPGGRWVGPLVTNAAMLALSLRDRLGV